MRSFEEVPEAVTKAFGDLSRFEEVLRDGFGVGDVVDPEEPYTQFAGISYDPAWDELLRDERTGLFLPASLAIQVMVNKAALHELMSTPDFNSSAYSSNIAHIRTYQPPADDLGPLVIIEDADSPPISNIMYVARLFMAEHGLAGKTTFDRCRYYYSTEEKSYEASWDAYLEKPVMHADNSAAYDYQNNLLASTARPTLMPLGTTILSVDISRLGDGYEIWRIKPHLWDDSNIVEVAPPGRIGLINGHTVHTQSFSNYARAYFDPVKGRTERFFAASDIAL
jgi:hypothetical protein